MVEGVIFDLDGVLVDSETLWDDARRAVVAAHDGSWLTTATRDMLGMSSREWSAYMHDRLQVPLAPERISAEVAGIVAAEYAETLPWLPGARDAVERLATTWPLGLASSANRTVIERFLDTSGLRARFAATVSSEEVARGKPAPDVYLAAAAGLDVEAQACVAIEDSGNGIRAGVAAAMAVIAVPNKHFPPTDAEVALAARILPDLESLTAEQVESAHP
jgi:HAD superfamily hydrolase (TIGR01509 family)